MSLLSIAESRGMFFKNYDYKDSESGPGEGLYSNMKDYKSVTEFREKKRKRRKKLLDKYFDGAKVHE